MLRPFRNKYFRRLFTGRLITNLGDSLYFVGAMWLVHELTGDPFYTGLAGFLTLLPGAFQFLAGPLVDRWPIRQTLVVTQVVQAVMVLTIPLAAYYDVLTVELVLVVMPTLALLNEFANPAMVTALPRLLDDEDLVAANSAFSMANQGIDMIGNGFAGLFIGLMGAVTLFALDAVTFGIAAALFAMTVVPSATSASEGDCEPQGGSDDRGETAVANGGVGDEADEDDEESYLDELRIGLDYIRDSFLLWLMLGAVFVNGTSGMALAAMPAFADAMSVPDILVAVGGAGAYGILMASFAAGPFLGAVTANLVDQYPFGWTLIVGLLVAGVCWVAAIALGRLPSTALLLMSALVPVGVINVQIAALIQSAPPKEVVGRVTSVLGSASVVTIPTGSLLGGAVADTFGPQVALFVAGASLLVLSAYVFALPGLRNLPRIEQVSI